MESVGAQHWTQNHLGRALKCVYALQPQVVTAGGAGDGTTIDGAAINRVDPNVFLSAKPAIAARCVLASGQSVVFERVVQHRDEDADDWEDYGEDVDDVTVPALSTAQTVTLDLGNPGDYGDQWSIDLAGAKKQVRLRVTPTLSASGTDTVALGGTLVLGGSDTVPPAGA